MKRFFRFQMLGSNLKGSIKPEILKGVESMVKMKWVLVCAAVLLVFGGNAVAGTRSDGQVFLTEADTATASAVLAAYVAYLEDGTDTALSVSNTLGVPEIAGVELQGFPTGGNTEGAVWAFCSNLVDNQMYVYSSSQDGVIGAGLTEEGILPAGGTWIVHVSEILGQIGFDLTERFVGYCYFVGEFDAIAGTYVNVFQTIASQQAFPMQSDFTGAPIWVVEAQVEPEE